MRVSGYRKQDYSVMEWKSNLRTNLGITLMLCAAFILQGILTVPLPYQALEAVTATGITSFGMNRHSPNHPNGESQILSDVSESDKQQRLRTVRTAERRIKDIRRLISQSLYVAAVSFTGILLLRSIGQSIPNRKDFCKSLLAISIGGHAPPIIWLG